MENGRSKMTEMLDRLVLALQSCTAHTRDGPTLTNAAALEMARVALEAMRVPTDEMILVNQVSGWPSLSRGLSGCLRQGLRAVGLLPLHDGPRPWLPRRPHRASPDPHLQEAGARGQRLAPRPWRLCQDALVH